jgi:hypothetical protein
MSNHRRSPYQRQIRANYLRTVASEPQPNAHSKTCIVFTCSLPTQAHAGNGLSGRYCGKHVRHLARHGSAHCNSYRAADMKPYIWSTEQWLRENKDQSMVKRIITLFEALLDNAGRPETAKGMLRAPAKSKAKVALARMRVRGIKPTRLLTITLATHAIVADDQSFSHRDGNEFLHVQIARQAHRLAARYVPPGYEGKVKDGKPWGFKAFPEGTGLVLRELGKTIDGIGEHLVDMAVPRILELKRTRFGNHASRPPLAHSIQSVAS